MRSSLPAILFFFAGAWLLAPYAVADSGEDLFGKDEIAPGESWQCSVSVTLRA